MGPAVICLSVLRPPGPQHSSHLQNPQVLPATKALLTFRSLPEPEFLSLNPDLEDCGTPGGRNLVKCHLPLLLEAPTPASGAKGLAVGFRSAVGGQQG